MICPPALGRAPGSPLIAPRAHGHLLSPPISFDAVPLLHQPLVVLTDRRCISACDAFTGAVRDLEMGTIVGTRAGGRVAGPAGVYLLDDGSVLLIPSLELGGKTIDGRGVAPDDHLPASSSSVVSRARS